MLDRSRRVRARGVGFVASACLLSMASVFACGQVSGSGFTGAASSGGQRSGNVLGGDATFGGGVEVVLDGGSGGGPALPVFTGPQAGPFSDFPSTPILDTADGGPNAAPSNAADLFGPATQGAQSGGPCLIEPEVGTLYPNNWLRPRFAWLPAQASDNLFELRLQVDNQANPLVVYTTQTQWTMPAAMWDGLRAHSQDVAMTVSVRSGQLNASALTNESLGSSGALGVAPVGAPGTIVYWAIVGNMSGTGVLKGFSIGDESVIPVLSGPQVQVNPAPAGNRACIGCHASTPDGLEVAFASEWSNYSNSIATIGREAGVAGGAPAFLTPAAEAVITKLNGVPAFSAAHWMTGDRIALLSDVGALNWVDLEGTAGDVQGVVARSLSATTGDPNAATTPTWSHDGSTIVYTSLAAGNIINGRPSNGPMDLYSVAYNARAGGDAVPLAGASSPDADEFYPSFSPDDRYIAFDTVAGSGGIYANASDELSIVPAAGGTATRLSANDPPACSNAQSPGVTNSWAKWSPSAQNVSVLGKTYYWVVFSSTRPHLGDSQHTTNPQLFVSAVVVDAMGAITTYHSLYLWNQPYLEDNHTPAWDVFQIPPVPEGPPR